MCEMSSEQAFSFPTQLRPAFTTLPPELALSISHSVAMKLAMSFAFCTPKHKCDAAPCWCRVTSSVCSLPHVTLPCCSQNALRPGPSSTSSKTKRLLDTGVLNPPPRPISLDLCLHSISFQDHIRLRVKLTVRFRRHIEQLKHANCADANRVRAHCLGASNSSGGKKGDVGDTPNFSSPLALSGATFIAPPRPHQPCQ